MAIPARADLDEVENIPNGKFSGVKSVLAGIGIQDCIDFIVQVLIGKGTRKVLIRDE